MRLVSSGDTGADAEATSLLDEGALVVVPTGTSYALVADALNEDAVARVFDVQRRSPDEPLTVFIGGFEDLHHVAYQTPLARDLADRHWPGALALVLRARPWLPDALTAGLPTVAVRVPADPFARALARHFGPYAAVPARRGAGAAPTTVAEAREALGGDASLYVDGGAMSGDLATVADATGATPQVLREGAVRLAEAP